MRSSGPQQERVGLAASPCLASQHQRQRLLPRDLGVYPELATQGLDVGPQGREQHVRLRFDPGHPRLIDPHPLCQLRLGQLEYAPQLDEGVLLDLAKRFDLLRSDAFRVAGLGPVSCGHLVPGSFVGVVPGSDVWEIVTTNIVVKGAITLISIPWIYWVRRGRGEEGVPG